MNTPELPNGWRPPWPWMTSVLPGIGGAIKSCPEDFEVEEIPAYLPSGTGTHLFLWVEKRDLTTDALVRQLARECGISAGDIGTAGLKDRQAVTRQYLSIPDTARDRLDSVTLPGVRILSVLPHENKLRTGHLQGNRFWIVVRNVTPDALDQAEAVAAVIREKGFPNYFGDQRFGRDAENVKTGWELLRGLRNPKRIPASRRAFLLRMSLSAMQSALFNHALAARMRDGTLHQVQLGDVMQVTQSGGPFVVDDPAREQPRLDAGEIVPAGPIFGPKMRQSTGAVAAFESELLAEYGITPDDFSRFRKLTLGTRRPYVVFPGDLLVKPHPDGVQLSFTLPSGSYATVLLAEFQKLGSPQVNDGLA